ncbi:MAG: TonB family protein, partial [Myxococcaceae bacterium]
MTRILLLILSLLSAAAAAANIVPPGAQCPGLPPYPASEIATQRAGKVTVRVTLDEGGTPTTFEVPEGQGMGTPFDETAIDGARACTFTAATREGKPVAAVIELAVDFNPPPLPAVLEGTVVGELGQPLTGAGVSAPGATVLTDAEGRFRLELAVPGDGQLWVTVARAGYAENVFPEALKAGETKRPRYALSKETILETRVTANRLLPDLPEIDKTPQVSRFQIARADIDRTPGALEDVNRVIQQLPGVVADPDLLATFFVRGGGPEEVIFYLDGVPLSNPFHLG